MTTFMVLDPHRNPWSCLRCGVNFVNPESAAAHYAETGHDSTGKAPTPAPRCPECELFQTDEDRLGPHGSDCRMDPMQPTLWVCTECPWSYRAPLEDLEVIERHRHEQRTGHVTSTVPVLVEKSRPRPSFPPVPTDAADLAASAARAFAYARSCLTDLSVALDKDPAPDAASALEVRRWARSADKDRKAALWQALQLLKRRKEKSAQERTAEGLAAAKGEVKP
ncbi:MULTISPECIES: hypothetical protein [unclassified Corallococcus]|uniref:hypothetical protein n=1 Tax=unclassified Corallococcus TaxID=2685029 RepID=UPI001A906E05|nr:MULTISPECIES: hypothetical protein [unclassified Corallococcus]MBN9685375.1 hypothetical protein [Corallococcus sp. NCSPR001]WAS83174.1 hypothetical protein O0N60_28115 [Corallococcus sp. NCRR]